MLVGGSEVLLAEYVHGSLNINRIPRMPNGIVNFKLGAMYHAGDTSCIKWIPGFSSSFVSAADDGTLKFHEILGANITELFTIKQHTAHVSSITFIPQDDQMLMLTTGGHFEMVLWHLLI